MLSRHNVPSTVHEDTLNSLPTKSGKVCKVSAAHTVVERGGPTFCCASLTDLNSVWVSVQTSDSRPIPCTSHAYADFEFSGQTTNLKLQYGKFYGYLGACADTSCMVGSLGAFQGD